MSPLALTHYQQQWRAPLRWPNAEIGALAVAHRSHSARGSPRVPDVFCGPTCSTSGIRRRATGKRLSSVVDGGRGDAPNPLWKASAPPAITRCCQRRRAKARTLLSDGQLQDWQSATFWMFNFRSRGVAFLAQRRRGGTRCEEMDKPTWRFADAP